MSDIRGLPRTNFVVCSPAGVKYFIGPSDVKMSEMETYRPPEQSATLPPTKRITFSNGKLEWICLIHNLFIECVAYPNTTAAA
jgi:hypothetical protein